MGGISLVAFNYEAYSQEHNAIRRVPVKDLDLKSPYFSFYY